MWPANNSAGKKTPGGAGTVPYFTGKKTPGGAGTHTGHTTGHTGARGHGKSLSQLLRMIATRNQNSPQTRSTVTVCELMCLWVGLVVASVNFLPEPLGSMLGSVGASPSNGKSLPGHASMSAMNVLAVLVKRNRSTVPNMFLCYFW